MANVNNPHGLRPLMRSLTGGGVQTEYFSKLGTYAYALYKWDPVTELAGYLNGPASGITVGTTYYLGVVLNWAAASLATNHQVITDPNALYEVQGDGASGTNVVAAKMGYNANLVITTAGAGVTRDNSGTMLGEASIATTSTLDMRIIQLFGGESAGAASATDNAFGAYARLEVKFNKHLRTAAVTAT